MGTSREGLGRIFISIACAALVSGLILFVLGFQFHPALPVQPKMQTVEIDVSRLPPPPMYGDGPKPSANPQVPKAKKAKVQIPAQDPSGTVLQPKQDDPRDVLLYFTALLLPLAGLIWAFLPPGENIEQEERQLIGHQVINDAVVLAKEVVPVSASKEKTAISRFWGRLRIIFNLEP